MDQVIGQVIGTWGTFGLVVIIMGWYIYNNIKTNKDGKSELTNEKFDLVNNKIDLLNDNVIDKYNNLSKHINKIDSRVDVIEEQVSSQPERVFQKFQEVQEKKIEMHSALLAGRINAGSKIHNILRIYTSLTGSDHMAIGLFHNGTTTLTGIPYYKFDIVAEKFDVDNENDYELAPHYKDTDIIRHDLLPLEIMQNTMQLYKIYPGCRLQNIDAILYGRTYGIGAKYLAIGIFKDENDLPAGFIGACTFKDQPINMDEFGKCLETMHQIYTEDINNLKRIYKSDNNEK